MRINPPSSVRTSIYVLSVFINASIAVLATSDVELSVWVMAGLAGFNAVVALMAGANVDPDVDL